MGCANCGCDRPPTLILAGRNERAVGGKLYRCEECGTTTAEPLVVVNAAEPTAASAATPPPEPKRRTGRTVPDVRATIKAARAEYRQVVRDRKAAEKELAALKKAERELKNLLDAADGKTSLAVVRQLPSKNQARK